MRTRLAIPILLLLALVACAKAPPQLSPAANQAFHKTQAIKALDVLRDTAIAAEANGVLSTKDTRVLVEYHKSALVIMDATATGWEPAVETGLDQALGKLTADERARVLPFVTLVKTVLHEVK